MVEAELLVVALECTPDGERLLILPPYFQKFAGSEPALNINQPDEALRLQLIDNAIAALRPRVILADLASLQHITPNLNRYPQLKSAVILADGSEKKKHLKAQAAFFKTSKIVGR